VRLLLDSHAALWALIGSERFGPAARKATLDAELVVVSVVTPWELGIKQALGKLHLPDGIVSAFEASGFEILPISSRHATDAPALPPHHRDPFDRMLIAQAKCEGLVIVTADHQFDAYDVETLKASA
jgi:PIN domain nuclease of toxin-antitoxin system